MSTQQPVPDPGAQGSQVDRPEPRERDRETPSHDQHGRSRAATVASLIGGGALAFFGIARRSLPGAAVAAGGGFLIYHGLSGRKRVPSVHVHVSYTINQPVEQVWKFWRNLENLPRFMSHLESVRPTSPRYSYWTARSPLGNRVSWHAEIIDERENHYLVWQSLPGSDIENVGSVELRPAPGNRGTEIHVTTDYRPPGGKLAEAVASLFGGLLQQQVREDVRHFKQLMEAGEIPTTEGQPHGRRSALMKVAKAARQQPAGEPASMQRTA
jgi:uncharacterized membrane protein